MNDDLLSQAFLHEHEAMNTTFTLRLLGLDGPSARSLAQLCTERVDQLESQLSRFAEGSDVSRINVLPDGETLYISEATHQCLLQAMEAAAATHGLFDITLGRRIEHRKSGADGPPPELHGQLVIHPDVPAVTCDRAGREIDLGGIGKGFALDQLRELLVDWGAKGALVTAGASSMLAYGEGAWPIELGGREQGQRLMLEGKSLSVSGTAIQGSHLVHPWGEEAMPRQPCERVWVVADSAAMAEVWSTALMLLELEEFEQALEGVPGIDQVHAQRDGKVRRVC
ncbi:MAG: FAD:protein FMN transferase [Akkermansiaceae bacterium]|nr:FAD:protein FMN transferase [Akkermansiaceae bacterium]